MATRPSGRWIDCYRGPNVPFKFTGKIDMLTFNLGQVQLTEEDRKQPPAIAEAKD